MTPGHLLQLLGFEWRYQMRRWTFGAVVAACVFMAWAMVSTAFGPAGVALNSPYSVMMSMALLSQWLLLTQTLFAVNGVLRDDEHGMRELVLSRPISSTQYLALRLGGMVCAGAVVMAVATLALALFPHLLTVDGARHLPMRPATYVWGFTTLLLPNLLLVSAVLCAVAAFARNTLATYGGAIALFGLYIVTALLVGSPMMAGTIQATPFALARAAVLDVFGASAFFEQARYWTPAERDVRLVALEGRYLLNRVMVLLLTGLIVALTHRFAPLVTLRSARPPWWRRVRVRPDRTPAPTHRYQSVPPSAGSWRSIASTLRSACQMELRQLLATRTLVAVALLYVLVVAIEMVSSLSGAEYGTRLLATSGQLTDRLRDPTAGLAALCLTYFGAEIVWRDRAVRIDGLIDSTPAPNGVFVAAKLFALMAMPVAMTLIGLLVGVVVQAVSHALPIAPSVFLVQGWTIAAPFLLLAIAVLALHVLAPERWTGIIATLGLVLITQFGSALGITHPMLRYGAVPALSWSDLDRLGPAESSFHAFIFYWATVAFLLGTIGWALWRRGQDIGLARRVRLAWQRSTAGGRALLAGSTLLVSVTGALLFRETTLVHAFPSAAEDDAWQQSYEQRYRPRAARAQPVVTAIDLAVDLTPARRLAEVRGTLAIENRSAAAIDTVWIAWPRGIDVGTVSVDAPHQVTVDREYRVHQLVLARSLAPGARDRLHFSTRIDRGGVRAGDFETDVAANGSYITSLTLLPWFGYQPRYELSDTTYRRTLGLGAPSLSSRSHTAIDSLTTDVRNGGGAPWVAVRTVLSASGGQVPLGPGRRVREWTMDDRRYVEFHEDRLVRPLFAIAAGRFAVRTVAHAGVTIEFWHHPTHQANVERLLDATRSTLDELSLRYGPYRLSTLRMVEIPSSWRFGAFATPGMLFFTENRGLLTDPQQERVDLLTRRVAHEVAHQWWGHSVSPLGVEGQGTLIESLAKYAEQRVVARVHGEDALPALLAFDHDRYLEGRARAAETEASLLAATDDSYLIYGKGALAFHALHRALGDSLLTGALRTLATAEAGPRGAATMPMLRELLSSRVTTAAERALIDEWFLERVVHDLRGDTMTIVRKGLQFESTSSFAVQRVTMHGAVEQALPADGRQVTIVLYAADDTPLHEARVTVRNGRAVLHVITREVPAWAEIDPRLEMIDRARSDNIVRGAR
jgi:ABC-2 type transport system permease protein